jgi:hypothetical protein
LELNGKAEPLSILIHNRALIRPDHWWDISPLRVIQHNPLIADGSVALGKFFAQLTRERARARVVVHRIIAVGDYVWAQVNFLNLFNDDANDTGIAGVDIYKDGRRRQGNRTLGHFAGRWRPEKLRTLDRAEHSARQRERNVLSRTTSR